MSADAFETTRLAESGTRPQRSSEPHSLSRWVGARFDHFEVQEPLGRGGMGAVYVGLDRSLDRRVAIKVLPEELAGDPELIERFVREARAQARLNSRHVAHIYYVGRTPQGAEGQRSSLFFAMELVDGGALEQTLDEGKTLDPERARQLMIQVARGLEDAHEAGIIHRDIKPSNLLLDRAGDLKIVDFGVAKPIGNTDSKITQEGAVIGSPLYMAPEQARGEELDQRADMYSLGASFYHLLSGHPPFEGPTALAVISRHLADPPVPLSERAPEVPAKLAAIVMRLLAKKPEDRFATYDQLVAALEAAAPAAARHAGFWTRGAAVTIDVALAGVVIGFLGLPGLALHLAYVTIAHAVRGQTLGKFLMNLSVQLPDGRRIGFGRSLLRTVSSMWLPFMVGLIILMTKGRGGLELAVQQIQLSDVEAFKGLVYAVLLGNVLLSLLYTAGLALAAFHPQKRAVHDLLVSSEVVYRLK